MHKVQAGETVRASHINALIDEINRVRPLPGKNVAVSSDRNGSMISSYAKDGRHALFELAPAKYGTHDVLGAWVPDTGHAVYVGGEPVSPASSVSRASGGWVLADPSPSGYKIYVVLVPKSSAVTDRAALTRASTCEWKLVNHYDLATVMENPYRAIYIGEAKSGGKTVQSHLGAIDVSPFTPDSESDTETNRHFSIDRAGGRNSDAVELYGFASTSNMGMPDEDERQKYGIVVREKDSAAANPVSTIRYVGLASLVSAIEDMVATMIEEALDDLDIPEPSEGDIVTIIENWITENITEIIENNFGDLIENYFGTHGCPLDLDDLVSRVEALEQQVTLIGNLSDLIGQLDARIVALETALEAQDNGN